MDNQKENDVDVAVNIFAKPWQTALSLLSLYRQSQQHINEYWLQFEPVGSRFDSISPYTVLPYLIKEMGLKIHVFQPEKWQARTPAREEQLRDKEFRKQLRYGNAFENTDNRYLFLTHNDVFFRKDLVGALKENIGGAFAIGKLGQCWNCPASDQRIMKECANCAPCGPDRYREVRPSFDELKEIYQKAREIGFPARPYDKNCFSDEFQKQPWPLPECRINEWACLINMQMVRPLSMPFGSAWPPGAYRDCSGHNLDVVTPFFRDLHAQGLYAAHFNISGYMDHWVGTGNKSAARYAYSEDRAKLLLEKFFPDFIKWVNMEQKGKKSEI